MPGTRFSPPLPCGSSRTYSGRIIASAAPLNSPAASLRSLKSPSVSAVPPSAGCALTGTRFAAPRKFATNAVSGCS